MIQPVLVGLDRDGTIIEDVNYLGRDDDWAMQIEYCKGVIEGVKKLRQNGRKVIVASNQAGIARDYFDCKRVEEINRVIDKFLRERSAVIDGWYYCPYVSPEYAKRRNLAPDNPWIRETKDRKPGIGMLEKACKDLEIKLPVTRIYFIGDTAGDVQTGLNANGKGIWIRTKKESEEEEIKVLMQQYFNRVFIADNFLSAVDIVLNDLN